jgi:hypothetical protein
MLGNHFPNAAIILAAIRGQNYCMSWTKNLQEQFKKVLKQRIENPHLISASLRGNLKDCYKIKAPIGLSLGLSGLFRRHRLHIIPMSPEYFVTYVSIRTVSILTINL